MSEYNEGDTLTFVRGDSTVTAEVCVGAVLVSVEALTRVGIDWLLGQGWRVSGIEKAKPKRPTEPGYYLPHSTGLPNVWLLNARGTWLSMPNVAGAKVRELDDRDFFGELTRLEPRAVTARAVLERMHEVYGEDYFHNSTTDWNKVAIEFGVTS